MATQAHHSTSRRDFIFVATGSVAAVGAAATVWPLINQMNPDASTLAMASIEFDISSIPEGQSVTIMWRGLPVFVRHRTQVEIDEAKAVPLADLKDPETDEHRTKEGRANWLVTMGVCTHLGCVPLGAGEGEVKGEFGGYFCPCHGSHYDTAGRIRKGPAPTNLEVPEYEFTSDTKILVG